MNFLLNNRKIIILITIVTTGLIAFGMIGMDIDSSITAVLPEDNSDFLYNQEISKTFTSSEEIIISILTSPQEEADLQKFNYPKQSNQDFSNINLAASLDNELPWSLYTVEHIELVKRVTEYVLSLDSVLKEGVNSIITIANQYDPESDTKKDEAITEATVSWVKKSIETNPMARGRIINQDHTNTVITVPIPNRLSYEDEELNLFLSNLEKGLNSIFKDYPLARYELTGQPKVKADITKYITADISFLLPIAIIVVMIAIFFLTRSFRGTLIPLIVTILSVVWTFGFKGLLGLLGFKLGALTLTESVLPVVLISVACADGIHITNQSLYFIDRGVPGKAAVYDAMQLVRLPVILAAITTAVGFGSLVFSPGRSLKNMGIFLAFGVLMAMIFSLILIPVLISYFKTQRFSSRRITNKNNSRFAFTKFLRPVTRFNIKFRWFILAFTLLLIIISIPAALNVKTDQDEVRFFVPKAPVRIATENIEKNLGGISTMYLVLQGTDEKPLIPREIYQMEQKDWDRMKQAEIINSLNHLRAVELIQKRAEMESSVSYTTSYISYLQLINYFFKGKLNKNNFSLPSNPGYFMKITIPSFEQQNMVGESITKNFITPTGDMLNTHIRLKESNTSKMSEVVKSINNFICRLYQIDPKELKTYFKMTPQESYTPPSKSEKQKRNGNKMLQQVKWLQDQAKKEGYKGNQKIENWYNSRINQIFFPGAQFVESVQKKNFLNSGWNEPLPDFAHDKELRMIADQFSVFSLKQLAKNPVRFRWAGDYIRIVNGSIIVDSQIISLAVATVIILILLTFIFRSPLTGFLLSIPVIIAIFLNFTVMWILGISLNPATSIIASVGMGVGIDYSIHYYSRFRKLYQMSGNYRHSLIEAAVQSSSGIILNALAVGVGFLVLYFSKYTIIKQMGLIVAFTMITSGMGALTILPALLSIFKPKISTKSQFI